MFYAVVYFILFFVVTVTVSVLFQMSPRIKLALTGSQLVGHDLNVGRRNMFSGLQAFAKNDMDLIVFVGQLYNLCLNQQKL